MSSIGIIHNVLPRARDRKRARSRSLPYMRMSGICEFLPREVSLLSCDWCWGFASVAPVSDKRYFDQITDRGSVDVPATVSVLSTVAWFCEHRYFQNLLKISLNVSNGNMLCCCVGYG